MPLILTCLLCYIAEVFACWSFWRTLRYLRSLNRRQNHGTGQYHQLLNTGFQGNWLLFNFKKRFQEKEECLSGQNVPCHSLIQQHSILLLNNANMLKWPPETPAKSPTNWEIYPKIQKNYNIFQRALLLLPLIPVLNVSLVTKMLRQPLYLTPHTPPKETHKANRHL